jgi:hypothetical protein
MLLNHNQPKNVHAKKKKINIICKFNLNNKCHFGNKCKFRHLNFNELNDILTEMENIKLENKSLKSELGKITVKKYNSNKKECDVTNDKENNSKLLLYNIC